MNDAMGAPSRVLRVVAAVVCGAVVLLASVAEAGPLADSLKWAAVPAAGFTFDHATSIAWSSHPSTCTEANLLVRNFDGTMNGPKSASIKAAFTGGFVAALYASKKLHWRPVEVAVKALMIGYAAQSSYYGVKSLVICR